LTGGLPKGYGLNCRQKILRGEFNGRFSLQTLERVAGPVTGSGSSLARMSGKQVTGSGSGSGSS
jgi:hypothetical protein